MSALCQKRTHALQQKIAVRSITLLAVSSSVCRHGQAERRRPASPLVEGISINKNFKLDEVQTTARRSLFQF